MAWIGRVLGWGQAALAGGTARAPWSLLLGGAVLTVGVVMLATAASVALVVASAGLGWPGLVLQALVLKSMLSLRGLAQAALAVREDLARADLRAARLAVGHDLVSRPTAGLDAAQVASATVESVAENLTDAFLAPVLFFLVFGLPGAVAYRVVNTADAMIGYREGALLYVGRLAARLDDVLNFIPARLAAIVLVAAAPLSGGDARRAWATMRRDHGRTASPNAGWTMAAMAGALGVALEKLGVYRLGDGESPGPDHILRSVRLLGTASALALVLLCMIGLTL